MNRRSIVCTLVALVFIAAVEAYAQDASQDHPTYGTLQKPEGYGSLQYECQRQSSEGNLRCKFVQVDIRKPEIGNRQKEAEAFLSDPSWDKECSQYGDFRDKILQAADGDRAKELGPLEKERLIGMLDRMTQFCRDRSLSAALSFVDFENEHKSRSCNVSTWTFEMVLNWNRDTQKWESIDGPRGGCGQIKHVSLEPDKPDSINVTFWNFRQRSVITNKAGEDFLGTCTDRPEEEVTYTWRTREVAPMCEYVKFGLF